MIFPLPTISVGECIAAVMPRSKEAWLKQEYCHVSYEGPQWRGHRLSYNLNVAAIDRQVKDGLLVLHSCHNKWCVNPNHLRLGTKKDNMIDLLDHRGEEYREVCSKSHLKKNLDPEHRAKLKKAAQIRWSDPEQKKAMSERMKGNKHGTKSR